MLKKRRLSTNISFIATVIIFLLVNNYLYAGDSKHKIVLSTNNKTSKITGRVLNEKKHPLARAIVSLGAKKAKCNTKGYFVIKNLSPGKYTLIVESSYYEKKMIKIKLKKRTLNIGKIILKKRKKRGNLFGTVKDQHAKPIPNVSVQIKELTIKTKTDKDGKYNFKNEPYGNYRLTFKHPKYATQKNKKVTITAGETNIINITLSPPKDKITKEKAVKIENNKQNLEELRLVRKGRKQAEIELKEIRKKLGEHEVKNEKGSSIYADESDEDIEITPTEPIVGSGISSLPEKKPNKLSSPSSVTGAIGDDKDGGIVDEESLFSEVAIKTKRTGLKASFVDDNKQFNYFLHFLEEHKKAKHLTMDVSERFIIKCKDKQGNSLTNVKITIFVKDNRFLETGYTLSDGSYLFFPKIYGDWQRKYYLRAIYNQEEKDVVFDQQDKRNLEIIFHKPKKTVQTPDLDLLFILDTTGSMGEEIRRLQNTIDLINLNITNFKPKPAVRFGLLLYKDKNDVYITDKFPFTSDINVFRKKLLTLDSNGGGDTPEDMQTALKEGISDMKWRTKGIHLAFIITDAPPHLDYGQKYTYVDASKEAKSKGIKIFSIGTGGLDINGEYVLRQISQFTSANYIFLTYGEKGESEGGMPGSVSHHTGENFQTDKLETILIQIVKRELKQFTGKEIEAEDNYFEANPIKDEKREETLKKLFRQAITQLYDFSSIKIEKNTTTAIAPIITTAAEQGANAEYFYDNLLLALSANKNFKAVARKDLQPILDELKFQLDSLSDDEKAAELGKFMGAKLLISGKMYDHSEYYEIFLRLMNIETVEILSVTKVRINKKLGL